MRSARPRSRRSRCPSDRGSGSAPPGSSTGARREAESPTKADALGTFAAAVTHARAAHGDRTDAGHDLTLGQMSVAHQPPAAIIGELVGMAAEQARNLGLDGLRQNRSRAVAQNLGQRIAKSSWLRELENVSVGHGVSLLCWRSGGVEHPHDTPPYPFTPSQTFAHSSSNHDEDRFQY